MQVLALFISQQHPLFVSVQLTSLALLRSFFGLRLAIRSLCS